MYGHWNNYLETANFCTTALNACKKILSIDYIKPIPEFIFTNDDLLAQFVFPNTVVYNLNTLSRIGPTKQQCKSDIIFVTLHELSHSKQCLYKGFTEVFEQDADKDALRWMDQFKGQLEIELNTFIDLDYIRYKYDTFKDYRTTTDPVTNEWKWLCIFKSCTKFGEYLETAFDNGKDIVLNYINRQDNYNILIPLSSGGNVIGIYEYLNMIIVPNNNTTCTIKWGSTVTSDTFYIEFTVIRYDISPIKILPIDYNI